MLANKGIAGDVKAETAHKAVISIGEPGGHELAGVAAMRDPGIE